MCNAPGDLSAFFCGEKEPDNRKTLESILMFGRVQQGLFPLQNPGLFEFQG
jgi:hypothetical protein